MAPDDARPGSTTTTTAPPPRERRVTMRDGTAVFVREWPAAGDARDAGDAGGDAALAPLILCDGLGCDGFIWPYIVKRFAGERRIVHAHYRGHGRSDVPADLDSCNIDVVIKDMAAVLDELGVTGGVWLGHSMGVQVCLEAARAIPERVRGLALLCGSFEKPIETWHHAFFEDEAAPFGNRLMRRIFGGLTQTVIDRWSTLQPAWKALVSSQLAFDVTINGELNPDLVVHDDFRPYMQHLANMDMRVFAKLARSLSTHSTRDYLPRVHVPTLIVGGGRDRFAPLWVSEEMHRLMPHGVSELLPLIAGSHTAPIEEPRLVEKALVRLLARVEGAAAARR
jgi:pimeloyl-ACP methyl ester carboxylesterase